MGFFKTDQEKRARDFYKAIEGNLVASITTAVAAGMPLDTRDAERDMTPLFCAVQAGALDAASYFVKAGANPNFAQANGTTCLMMAATKGHAEIARLLLDNGADVKLRQRVTKSTALHLAAEHGRGNIAKLLLEAGADKTAQDRHLRTPSDVAASDTQSIQRAIVKLITDWGQKEPDDTITKDATPKKDAGENAAAPKSGENPAAGLMITIPQADGWRLTGANEVTNITSQEDIGYRLTETFNFRSGVYARIAHNLTTGAESQTIRFFDEFGNSPLLDRAREALRQLGGTEPAETRRHIDKPGFPKQLH